MTGTDEASTRSMDTDQRDCSGNETANWLVRFEHFLRYLPYPTLALSIILALADLATTSTDRILIIGLSVAVVAWTTTMYTFAGPSRRHQRVNVTCYYVGFLVLAALLIAQNPIFFIYTINGFFHAYLLKPWKLGFAGVFATSLVLNTGTMGIPDDAGGWTTYLAVIGIQTVAIGSGLWISERDEQHTARREQLVGQLREALEENVGLHAQLLVQARESGVLDERQRMAREIHDTLAQGFSGIVTQLEAASRRAAPAPERQRHIDNALLLARDGLTEARRTVHAVRPEPLDGARLPEAIGEVAERWSERQPDSEVTVQVTGVRLALHPEVEVALLRTAQEALTNVAKHAQASRVGLTLSYMEDSVALDVRDDGVGFDPERLGASSGDGHGFGLTGMRQRVRRLAGRFAVESEPGGGTAISAAVPAIPNVLSISSNSSNSWNSVEQPNPANQANPVDEPISSEAAPLEGTP